jgi:SAM-dependent methyltransferase
VPGADFSVQVEVTPPPARPVPAFGRWVAESVTPGARVLNIGGGCNVSGRHPRIRRRSGWLVAVDPSGRIHADSDADERYQLTLEEYAATHAEQFDVAFAVFVLEHVEQPDQFVQAAATVLRPGGLLFALTPNLRHYFGLATWAANRLRIEEPLLKAVRDRNTVARYHVPTEYRLNSIRAVSAHLQAAGFAGVEFRMWDLPRMYEPYLPGPLRHFAAAWSRLAYRTGRPNLMGHLTFRATR